MPVKKETETKKTTTRKTPVRKTPVAKKTTTASAKQVAANARHIEENAKEIKNNSSMIHILYWAIIFLLLIIAGLAFYVGQMLSQNTVPGWTVATATAEDITVTVIDDSRCSDCQTDEVAGQIQGLSYLSEATFLRQDFSDAGVAEYLQENNITALPAIIFSGNNINDAGQIVPYLTALPDGQFSLALGAKFNPFAERSDKWFLMLDEQTLWEVTSWLFIDGNTDATLTWLEYSDVNCFYCKKMAQDGTVETVLENKWSDLNHSFVSFIWVGWAATQEAAEVMECIGDESWAEVYASVFNESLVSEKNSTDDLLAFASDLGADVSSIQTCIDENRVSGDVTRKFEAWRNIFGVTGTPGNVILNNLTGEYELISGAYPVDAFEEVVERMLAN